MLQTHTNKINLSDFTKFFEEEKIVINQDDIEEAIQFQISFEYGQELRQPGSFVELL